METEQENMHFLGFLRYRCLQNYSSSVGLHVFPKSSLWQSESYNHSPPSLPSLSSVVVDLDSGLPHYLMSVSSRSAIADHPSLSITTVSFLNVYMAEPFIGTKPYIHFSCFNPSGFPFLWGNLTWEVSGTLTVWLWLASGLCYLTFLFLLLHLHRLTPAHGWDWRAQCSQHPPPYPIQGGYNLEGDLCTRNHTLAVVQLVS